MSNEKLFDYATMSLYEQGGDGSVLVVVKQQLAETIAGEFESWEIEKHPTNPKMRMARLEAHTPGKVQFSDMSNENLCFMEWPHYKQFLLGETTETPFGERELAQWDTVIITW